MVESGLHDEEQGGPLENGSYLYLNNEKLTEIIVPDDVLAIRCHLSGWQGKKIILPNTLKVIGSYAFYNCNNLESITIPDSVESIGGSAFYFCSSLRQINIPSGVSNIYSFTFYSCSNLESVQFSENSKLANIGYGAFSDCSSLKSINIPNGVISIDEHAFIQCHSLETITIPNSMAYMYLSAFSSCSKLTDIHYAGTKSQWTHISHANWEYTNPTVHCTDGDIIY